MGESESHSVMSDSLRPHGLYSPWNSPGQNTGWVAVPFSRGSSQPRDQTQADSLPIEPQGKSKIELLFHQPSRNYPTLTYCF